MVPADPDYGIHPSRKPAEELLIYAVLSRAIHDLFGVVGLTSNKSEAEAAKHEALMFLTQATGGWAKRRNELCDAIGFDGEVVRTRVVRVLEGDTSALDTFDGRGALSDVAHARELWELEKQRSAQARRAFDLRRRQRDNPPPQSKSRRVKYIEARPKILGLLSQPHTVQELSDATGYTDGVVRTVINNAVAKGELRQNGTQFSVPETAVAAATG